MQKLDQFFDTNIHLSLKPTTQNISDEIQISFDPQNKHSSPLYF